MKVIMPAERRSQHGDAEFEGQQGLIRLVQRRVAGHPFDTLKAEHPGNLDRRPQVADVDRVERPAENQRA